MLRLDLQNGLRKLKGATGTSVFLLGIFVIIHTGQAQTLFDLTDIETVVREYYRHFRMHNYAEMRAMTTPGFRITYDGVQLDGASFEARHRVDEQQQLGPVGSRPDDLRYELSDFKTEVSPDVAYVSCEEISAGGDGYYNLLVLQRSEDQWLIDQFFHMMSGTSTGED